MWHLSNDFIILHVYYKDIISWSFAFWENKTLIGSSEFAVEFTADFPTNMLSMSERVFVLYHRKGMSSLFTQYIITGADQNFLNVVC